MDVALFFELNQKKDFFFQRKSWNVFISTPLFVSYTKCRLGVNPDLGENTYLYVRMNNIKIILKTSCVYNFLKSFPLCN